MYNDVKKSLETESIDRLKSEFVNLFSEDEVSHDGMDGSSETSIVRVGDVSEISTIATTSAIIRSEYTPIENYDAPEIDAETTALVKRNAWIRIKSPEEFIKILNSKNPERFFLDNALAKRNEMIKGAEIELGRNQTLRAAYESALSGDCSKINKGIFKIRDELTNSPVIGTMALKLVLQGNALLLIWYIENVPSDNDDMLNSFFDVYLHTLVTVLMERPSLIKPVREAFMKPDGIYTRRHKYNKFNIDSNSGLVGITPFQLALMTYNHELINLLIDMKAIPYYVDIYGNLFLREVAACRYDKSSLIRLLKQVNYDVLKKDINGEDQIDIAIKNKDVYYIAYLLHMLYLMQDHRFDEAFERVKSRFSEKKALLSGLEMLHSPVKEQLMLQD